jgi:hypothetical protein
VKFRHGITELVWDDARFLHLTGSQSLAPLDHDEIQEFKDPVVESDDGGGSRTGSLALAVETRGWLGWSVLDRGCLRNALAGAIDLRHLVLRANADASFESKHYVPLESISPVGDPM